MPEQFITAIRLSPPNGDTQNIVAVWYGNEPTFQSHHQMTTPANIILLMAVGYTFWVADLVTKTKVQVIVVNANPPHLRTVQDRTVRDNLLSLPHR